MVKTSKTTFAGEFQMSDVMSMSKDHMTMTATRTSLIERVEPASRAVASTLCVCRELSVKTWKTRRAFMRTTIEMTIELQMEFNQRRY